MRFTEQYFPWLYTLLWIYTWWESQQERTRRCFPVFCILSLLLSARKNNNKKGMKQEKDMSGNIVWGRANSGEVRGEGEEKSYGLNKSKTLMGKTEVK